MSTITIVEPETTDERENARLWVERARSVRVFDGQSAEFANTALGDLKSARKRISEKLDPIVSQAHQTHSSLVALRKQLVDPLDQAERMIKGALGAYLDEQRAIAEKARRDAEEAERKRVEEARLAEASRLEQQGRHAEAEAVVSAPEERVNFAAPKIEAPKGVSTRETWSADVRDIVALARYVVEHPEYRNLLVPNLTALNELARVQCDKLAIPGVVPVRNIVVSKR